MNTYSSDEFNALVEQVRDLSNKTDQMADSIALIDASVNKTKYLTKLLDVNVSYPAENDVLVYDKTGKWKNAQYDEIGFKPGEGGESDIYVISIGDETPATNENVYSAARTIEDWVSSKNDDTIEGNITFAEGKNLYIDGIQSRFASQGTDLGSGFVYKIKSGGTSYLEIDELAVRKTASFNTLEIKKVTSVSGNMVISPASNNIIRVEETTQYYENSYQSVWRCIFREEIEEDGEIVSQIKTDFQPGDLAKIQEFNIQTGISEDVKNRFYWGKVLGVGKNYIDLSKTDVDPATNTQPMAGDALVMYGHKGDTYEDLKRQNVISISTYADNAPAIQMYQGLNDYSTENKAIIELAYDSAETQQQAYMNVYGRMYVGTKDRETSYIKYDPTINGGAGLLTVKATIIVKDPDDESDVTLIEGGYIRTNLLKVKDIVANAGTISNSLSVGYGKFFVDGNGNLTARGATLTSASISGDIIATSGTFHNVNINSGNIGGFTINSSNLSSSNWKNSMTLSNESIKFTSSDSNYTKTMAFGVVSSSISGIDPSLNITFGIKSDAKQGSLQNVGLYIECNGAERNFWNPTKGNIAIWAQNGMYKGLRLSCKYVSMETSGYTVDTDYNVHFVRADNTDVNNVYLPATAKEGDVMIIAKCGQVDIWLHQNQSLMYRNGNWRDKLKLNWGGFALAIYTETYNKNDSGYPGMWFICDTVAANIYD